MIIPMLTMNSPYARHATKSGAQRLEGIVSEAVIHVQGAVLDNHGPELNGRPRLKLWGVLSRLTPRGASIPGVTGLYTDDTDNGLTFDMWYEFNNTQLQELVAKGLFDSDFQVPDILANNNYVLPVVADYIVVEPSKENDVPCIFVSVHGRSSLTLDLESANYDLAQYFEQHAILTPEQLASYDQAVQWFVDQEVEEQADTEAVVEDEPRIDPSTLPAFSGADAFIGLATSKDYKEAVAQAERAAAEKAAEAETVVDDEEEIVSVEGTLIFPDNEARRAARIADVYEHSIKPFVEEEPYEMSETMKKIVTEAEADINADAEVEISPEPEARDEVADETRVDTPAKTEESRRDKDYTTVMNPPTYRDNEGYDTAEFDKSEIFAN